MEFFFCTLNGIHCFPELYRGGTTLIQSQQLLRNYWSSWLSFKKRQGDRLAPGILGKAFFTTSKWNLRLCILCFQQLNNTTFASLRWVTPPTHTLVNFGSCHQPLKVSFPASGRRYPLGGGGSDTVPGCDHTSGPQRGPILKFCESRPCPLPISGAWHIADTQWRFLNMWLVYKLNFVCGFI